MQESITVFQEKLLNIINEKGRISSWNLAKLFYFKNWSLWSKHGAYISATDRACRILHNRGLIIRLPPKNQYDCASYHKVD